jgi:hypothetical protein
MAPVASPAHIGEPSLIKHAFLIIRENRTYDQILGDVAAGNGDAELALFGGQDTPNAHALVQRFPLLRSDPDGNAGDALAYTKNGFVFQEAVQAGTCLLGFCLELLPYFGWSYSADTSWPV